eukprot:gene12754-7030_t
MNKEVLIKDSEIKKQLDTNNIDKREYVKVGSNVFYHEEEKKNEERFTTKNTTQKHHSEEEKKYVNSTENLQNNSTTSSTSLVDILKKNWKQKHEKVDEVSISEGLLLKKASTEGYLTRKELLESEEQNPTLTQFQQELSPEEKELIVANMKRQKKNFLLLKQRDRKHRVLKVKIVHPYLSNEEIITSLENDCETEEESVVHFTNFSYLHEIRRKIAVAHGIEDSMEIEQIENSNKKTKKGNKIENETDEDIDDEFDSRRKRKQKKKKKKDLSEEELAKENYVRKRLKLDDALSKSESFEGWSPARIKAYKLLDTNPNAYYYRFNAPEENQKNGAWSKEEKELFFERIKTFDLRKEGATQWGIFSMTIPGRVGYQCSNFYRHLVKKGEIKDPDYFVDSQGQVHCKYGKGCRSRKKRGNNSQDDDIEFEKKLRKKKKKDSEDDDEIIYASSNSNDDQDLTPTESNYTSFKSTRLANPLPGFKDPITMEQIVKPTISPYGHVMGYDTWLRILSQEPKNKCPFTKQDLFKRDLIKLNFDNISKYQDLIKNN